MGNLSTEGALFIGLIGIGAMAMLLFRRGFSTTRPAGVPEVHADSAEVTGRLDAITSGRDSVMRIPRLLFYLGAITVALASIRPAMGLTVSELFFLMAFGAAVIGVLAGRPVSRLPAALIAGVALFALGGLISSPGAASPARSVVEVMQAIYVLLLWVWTGATVLRTRPQLATALTMWTISAAVDGFAAITQVLGSEALGGPLEGNRATGLTDHPNDLGGVCAIALVPALMLATSRIPGYSGAAPGSMLRGPRWAILALIAAGLVLSASVGAMIAGFVAILVWLVAPAVRAPGRLAVITALAFTMVAMLIAGGRVASPTERLQEVTSSGTGSTSGSAGIRVKTVRRALPRIADNPVVGTGFDPAGGVVNVINQGRSTPYQVHGAPVAVWYETGIFGLIGVITVVATLARNAWRSLGAGDQVDLLIGLSIFGAFVAFLIHAMAIPFYLQQYGWITAVMLIAWRYRRDASAQVVVATGMQAPAPPPRPATAGATAAPAIGAVPRPG